MYSSQICMPFLYSVHSFIYTVHIINLFIGLLNMHLLYFSCGPYDWEKNYYGLNELLIKEYQVVQVIMSHLFK